MIEGGDQLVVATGSKSHTRVDGRGEAASSVEHSSSGRVWDED